MAWWRGGTARVATLVAIVVVALVASAAVPAAARPFGWKGVSLSAGRNLLDGQPVTVTGDGYSPGTTTIVRQCFGPRSIDCAFNGANSVVASIGGDGSFEVDILVFRTATLEGGDHDCTTTDACSVQVTGQHDGQIDLPISFAPTGSYRELSVSPSTGLLDGHHVDVAGAGFAPGGDQLIVTQCGPGPAVSECASIQDAGGRPYAPPNLALAQAGGDGSLVTDLLLYRTLSANGQVDCAVEACSVRVYSLDDLDDPLASAPVAFAPSGTYQWPAATFAVTPATGVRDGQSVAVTGAGLSRWYMFSITVGPVAPAEICRAVPDPDPEADCVFGLDFDEGPDFRLSFAQVDRQGQASGSVTVERWLDLPSGEWDCAVGGCTLALSQGRNPVSNRVPLSFGPEWSPYPSAGTFVDEVYGQMIGAPLTSADRSALIASLTSRATTGAQAIVDATSFPGYGSSIPAGRHDQVIADVTRTYVAFFGRRPDTPGLAYWVGRRESGTTAGQVARLFGGTPEFRAAYDGLSNAQVVDRAYLRILGRASDPSGRAYWLGQLAAGMTRDRMVHIMSAAPEHRAQQDAHARIEVMTFGLAGRAATAREWAATPLEVARALVAAG